MTREPSLARRIWRQLEPIHAVTYFAPEARAAFDAAGYRGYWMSYFAGRAAPLGPVGQEVVTALFYNFSPARVAKALPDAWGFAAPGAALDARLEGSIAALRRAVGDLADSDDVATAATLAGRAARSAPLAGRVLFAANLALAWPDDPLAELWHSATMLREHRGDGHVAALVAAGIGGREANVIHSAAGGPPREVLAVARDYDDEEWDATVRALEVRGLMTTDGALTVQGQAVKDDVEERTDRLAVTAYDTLDDGEIDQLLAAVAPLAAAVVAAGDVPLISPMGLNLGR
ncbi:MAG: hypothetical protein M3337_01675 [Actinomycetota bacterium]|nr:hypothetical protein [Actinomycetota bacterium]